MEMLDIYITAENSGFERRVEIDQGLSLRGGAVRKRVLPGGFEPRNVTQGKEVETTITFEQLTTFLFFACLSDS